MIHLSEVKGFAVLEKTCTKTINHDLQEFACIARNLRTNVSFSGFMRINSITAHIHISLYIHNNASIADPQNLYFDER